MPVRRLGSPRSPVWRWLRPRWQAVLPSVWAWAAVMSTGSTGPAIYQPIRRTGHAAPRSSPLGNRPGCVGPLRSARRHLRQLRWPRHRQRSDRYHSRLQPCRPSKGISDHVSPAPARQPRSRRPSSPRWAPRPPTSNPQRRASRRLHAHDREWRVALHDRPQYNVTAQAIMQANGISSPDKIFVGQKLIIPGRADLVVKQAPAAPKTASLAPAEAPLGAKMQTLPPVASKTAAITNPKLVDPNASTVQPPAKPTQVAEPIRRRSRRRLPPSRRCRVPTSSAGRCRARSSPTSSRPRAPASISMRPRVVGPRCRERHRDLCRFTASKAMATSS